MLQPTTTNSPPTPQLTSLNVNSIPPAQPIQNGSSSISSAAPLLQPSNPLSQIFQKITQFFRQCIESLLQIFRRNTTENQGGPPTQNNTRPPSVNTETNLNPAANQRMPPAENSTTSLPVNRGTNGSEQPRTVLTMPLASRGTQIPRSFTTPDTRRPDPLILAQLPAQLNEACRQGDARAIRRCIVQGANVTSELFVQFCRILNEDELCNFVDLFVLNLNLADYDRNTPLQHACSRRFSRLTEMLLARGADFNATDRAGRTPIQNLFLLPEGSEVEREGEWNIIKQLLRRGAELPADPNNGNHPIPLRGRPLFDIAVEREDLEAIELLNQRGVPIPLNTLINACGNRSGEVVRALTGDQVPVDSRLPNDWRDQEGKTLLMIAAFNGRADVVRVLQEVRGEIDATTADGSNALHFASAGGHEECVRALVELGLDPNTLNQEGYSPLHMAAYRGSTRCVRALIELGANVNILDPIQMSPLLSFVSARADHPEEAVETFNALLNAGADLNQRDREGKSALHLACFSNNLTYVDRILQNGNIEIDVRDQDQNTPLHLGCREGHLEIVDILIQRGASLDPINSQELTPLDLACYSCFPNVVERMLEAGAQTISPGNTRHTALHTLAISSYDHNRPGEPHLEILRILLQHRVDVNAQTADTLRTALHFANVRGNQGMIDALVQAGANPQILDRDQHLPASYFPQQDEEG